MSERPRAAGVLATILFVESAAVLAIAAWLAISAVGDDDGRQLLAGLFFAACLVGGALFLLQAGRAVLDGRSWARSATVVWQVLQMGVAFGTCNGAEGPVPIALALFVPAIAALVLVFRRSVRTWLSRERMDRMGEG